MLEVTRVLTKSIGDIIHSSSSPQRSIVSGIVACRQDSFQKQGRLRESRDTGCCAHDLHCAGDIPYVPYFRVLEW